MMLGTLNYMSPEQVRGERTDHRSDIFSIGVVLYEMLSGRKAFQGDSFATTLYKILQDDPEPLRTIDPALPPEVVALVDRALVKARDERYQDLAEVARDLAFCRQQLSLADAPTMVGASPGSQRIPSDAMRRAAFSRPDSGQRTPPPVAHDAPTMLAPSSDQGLELQTTAQPVRRSRALLV